jgi:integrase/recombinase XerC/integrase/recombinase XerD
MLASGISVGEAAKLIKQDIRLDNNRLILFIRKAKGGKSRTVPVINPEVALQLYEYAKEVPDGQPLFRVAKRTLQGHAERIKKNTGMNFYSHRARHTFATKLLAKDTRLDVIQRVMGHADISTTRKYAETLNQDILSIAEPINIDEDTDEDMKKESE